MLRAMMTVSGFTLVSRILGFLRDILIARFVGTGPVADAFVAAFRFPNMFRRIFGEGAYNAAFVPLFGRKVEEAGTEEAIKFARNTFSSLLWALGLVTLIAIPCMHWLMMVVVPGFLPKLDKDLGEVGAQQAVYKFEVDTVGASDIYLQIEGNDGAAAQWAPRVIVEEMGFIMGDHGLMKVGVSPGEPFELTGLTEKSLTLSGDRESGVERDVIPVPGEELLLREGEEIVAAIYGMEGGLARIKLPVDHRFKEFRARIRVMASTGAEMPQAALRVYRNHPDNFDLTVALSRIMFVYLLFMALSAHLSGVLNTFKKFAMPAAAPIILNIVLVSALGLIWVMGYKGDLEIGKTLAWGVAIAGLLQFVALWVACAHAQAAMTVGKPIWNPELKRLLFLMGPGVIAAGIQQVNLLVGGIIASFQQGAISILYYADRVNQLPLGMIGIALGVVLLPEVTRCFRSGREREAAASILKGMELAMLLTLPAAVAMMVIHEPLISGLFEGREFDAEDVRKTGWALAGFALGLPGYVLIKVLQPVYFARENTKSPMIMAGVAVAVNIVFSIVLFNLMRPTGYGQVGIAIATAISAWVNVLLLWKGMKGFVVIPGPEKKKLLMMLIASAGMGLAVWLAAWALESWMEGAKWMKIAAVGLMVGTGMTVYAILVILLRATSVKELKAGFRKS